jgi:hypothetical protein
VAAKPNQKSGHAIPLGSDGKPPRRGKIERSWVAPDLADDGGQSRASQPLLHDPEGIAGVAHLDMDKRRELAILKSRRMNPPRLQDRHSFLHPQQGAGRVELG